MSIELQPLAMQDIEAGPDFGLPRTLECYPVINISRLRDSLGHACRLVAGTEEPLVVQRYSRQEVAIVPLWMWQNLMDLAVRTEEVHYDAPE